MKRSTKDTIITTIVFLCFWGVGQIWCLRCRYLGNLRYGMYHEKLELNDPYCSKSLHRCPQKRRRIRRFPAIPCHARISAHHLHQGRILVDAVERGYLLDSDHNAPQAPS